VKVSRKLESLEKQNLIYSDSTDQQYDNNFGLLSLVYLPVNSEVVGPSGGSGGEADAEGVNLPYNKNY
jgi:hypothetical protein